jgi:signal peptidase II
MRSTIARLRIFLPVFAGAFLSDCASKRVAVEQLSPAYVPHEVFGDVVRFTLAYNVRAAMGLTAGAYTRWILAAMAAVMLAGIVYWTLRSERVDRLTLCSAALIGAGALGNLIDRIRWDRGVVDFIDVGFGDARFYIFNVADAAITIGAVLLWFSLRRQENTPPAPPHAV